jgi:hypothetical protein
VYFTVLSNRAAASRKKLCLGTQTVWIAVSQACLLTWIGEARDGTASTTEVVRCDFWEGPNTEVSRNDEQASHKKNPRSETSLRLAIKSIAEKW